MPTKIKFETSDGMTFDVDVPAARCFRALPTMVGYRDLDEIPDDEVIPLENVKAVHFEKVLQWAQIHQDNPEEPAESHGGEWEHEFLQANTQRLNEVINVASYLQIPHLEYLLREEVLKRGLSEFRKTHDIEEFQPKIEEDTPKDTPVEALCTLMGLLNTNLDLLKEPEQPRRVFDNLEPDFLGLAMTARNLLADSEPNLLDLGMGGWNPPQEGEQMRDQNLLDMAIGGGNWSEKAGQMPERNLLDMVMGGQNFPKKGEQQRKGNDEPNLLDLGIGGWNPPEEGEQMRDQNLLDMAIGGGNRSEKAGQMPERNLLDMAMGGTNFPKKGEQKRKGNDAPNLLDLGIGGWNPPVEGEQMRDQNLLDMAMGGGNRSEKGGQTPERNLLDKAMGGQNLPKKGEQKRKGNDESNLLDLAMGGQDSSEDAEKKARRE